MVRSENSWGDTLRRAAELRHTLEQHNDSYVRRMVSEHSKLLIEELGLDEEQLAATVRDDHCNLVIAGAGSGKTRTIVARVLFLLERGVPAPGILAVTFTNKATDEMQTRLQRMGVSIAGREVEGVTVSTLHALGKRIVQATAQGPISVADDKWTDSLVAGALRDARNGLDPHLARLYIKAILYFHRDEDERAPAIAPDKIYRTLRGEHVRSLGERIIADFMFINGVGYKYEARATWAHVGEGRDAYHPDFKLTDVEAYIEYWGINRAGEVAGWMDTTSAEYREGMDWKREQFHREGKVLVEFYEYERTEGTLEVLLEERLRAVGVTRRPMTLDELQNVVGEMKYVGSAIERVLAQFIANARALGRQPNEIHSQLAQAKPRTHHFGLLGIAILERYQARLASEGRIDFSEMLHRAAETLERGGANPLPGFAHVLVDEFQDTSAPMSRFLKALISRSGARLFAVGDDWQAIYGFAGGDVDHIINFESHFGPASTTMLSTNYRSPLLIVEAGGALIARNKNQVAKQVVVFSRERGEAYIHEVQDDDMEMVNRSTLLILQEMRQWKPEEILVLSRTGHALEAIGEACRRRGIPVANPEREVPGVRIMSAHKAKGLEASVVIVVNVSDHLFGFPSKVESPDLLEPVRLNVGDGEAEERRLFYVVITRAIRRLHLIVRQGLPSPYLAEIEGDADAPRGPNPAGLHEGARFAGAFRVERLYPVSERQTKAGIRQVGVVTTTGGGFTFTSWANVYLQEGAIYWLHDVLKDWPYRDQQRIKLDQRTRLDLRQPPRAGPNKDGMRELRPRPPPSHEPRFQGRST